MRRWAIDAEPIAAALASWGLVLQVIWWFRKPSRVARLKTPGANYSLTLQEHWKARVGLAIMCLGFGAIALFVGTKGLHGWNATFVGFCAALCCVVEGRIEFQGWNGYEMAASTYKWLVLCAFVVKICLF